MPLRREGRRSPRMEGGRSFVLIGLALAASGPALATTFEPLSLEHLIQEADLIVQGRVLALSPPSKGEAPSLPSVTIRVEKQWKRSEPVSTLTIPHHRVSHQGITEVVPGFPVFHENEAVLLFLVQLSPGRYEPLGGKQGKLTILADPAHGPPVAQGLEGIRYDLQDLLHRLDRTTQKPLP